VQQGLAGRLIDERANLTSPSTRAHRSAMNGIENGHLASP